MAEMSEILKLYQKGKLGNFPIALLRVRAGIRVMNDYRKSMFVPRTTRVYQDVIFCGGKNVADTMGGSRTEAADRYLGAVRAAGKYQAYVLHFLRDDKNAAAFVRENPVLNKGRKTTYKSIYAALCEMLDLMVAYYDSLPEAETAS